MLLGWLYGFKFKFEIEDSRWFLQFGLWVKVLCTRSQFLLFMLLRLLYSLLQELRRVLLNMQLAFEHYFDFAK